MPSGEMSENGGGVAVAAPPEELAEEAPIQAGEVAGPRAIVPPVEFEARGLAPVDRLARRL